MYQYPDKRQLGFGGDFQNPRGQAVSGYSPVPIYNGGAYDGQVVQPTTVGRFMPQANVGSPLKTFGLDGTVNGYAQYAAPIANMDATTAPKLNWAQELAKKYLPHSYAGGVKDSIRFKEGAGEILDQAGTGWNKMSFAEKGSTVLGGVGSALNAYNSFKAGKLANEQFQFTKDSFNKNFNAQAKTTNSALADRQTARVARDPKTFASVKDYMKKYGV